MAWWDITLVGYFPLLSLSVQSLSAKSPRPATEVAQQNLSNNFLHQASRATPQGSDFAT